MEGSNFIYEYPVIYVDNHKMMPEEGCVVIVASSHFGEIPTTDEQIDAFLENGGTFKTFGITNEAFLSFEEKFTQNGKRRIPTELEYNQWKLEFDNK